MSVAKCRRTLLLGVAAVNLAVNQNLPNDYPEPPKGEQDVPPADSTCLR